MQAPVLRITKNVTLAFRRNFGATAPVLQTDPIQQLFLDKIREYKKKTEGGKTVELTPEMDKEMKNDLLRLEKQYGAQGADMKSFPSFNFPEPKFDPTSVKQS